MLSHSTSSVPLLLDIFLGFLNQLQAGLSLFLRAAWRQPRANWLQAIIASPFYYYQRRAFLKPSLGDVLCTGKLIHKKSSPAHFAITNGGHFWNRRCLTCAARANWLQAIIASPFYYYQRRAFLKPSLFYVRCTGKLITIIQHTDQKVPVDRESSGDSWSSLSGKVGCLSWEPPSVCQLWHSS